MELEKGERVIVLKKKNDWWTIIHLKSRKKLIVHRSVFDNNYFNLSKTFDNNIANFENGFSRENGSISKSCDSYREEGHSTRWSFETQQLN